MAKDNKYQWKYCSLGGVVRVKIESGEDIAHLGELDQKLWTVLSCPVQGLEFDAKTLQLIDADGDGKIRVPEIVASAEWLTSVIKDKDLILKGEDTLPLDQINTENPEGAKLCESAKQILGNLGLEKNEISIADTSDSVAIFAGTRFNGDGIITPISAGDDEELKSLITNIIEKEGSETDRCGEAGVTADHIEKFFADAAAFSAWHAAAEADKANIFPYGDSTDAAAQACDAIKAKVEDYFMRCKLIAFNEDAAGALDVSVDRIGAISALDLSTQAAEIEQYPIARPRKSGILPVEGINPSWQAAFSAFKALVLDVDFAGKDGITEDEWKAVMAKLAPYAAWKAAKAGDSVEALGIEAVDAILKADRKQALLDLVAADKELEDEAASIDAVDKLTHLYRDFAKLLTNYVCFSDFYEDKNKAIFNAGRLFIDQRCCELCVRVADMGQHGDIPALSGMFLLYCNCVSKAKGTAMDIVAVMTAGNIRNLRPGTHGVFYDREGADWDATITKIVDTPISVRQAFWSPYRKLGNFISSKIDKSAADKDTAAIANLQAKADAADPAAPKGFDVSKFASIFAIVGVALAAVTAAFAAVIAVLKGLTWWKWLIVIAAIMLVISGPACFIAWRKLRKRNLGPVLNANGWAINSTVLVNILFGKTLTNVAKYPKMNIKDPYATPAWKKWLWGIVAALVVAFAVLFFTNTLAPVGLPFHKKVAEPEVIEEVVEEAAEATDGEETPAVEEAAAEEPAAV